MSRVVVNEIEAKVGNDITFNDTVKISTAQIDTVRGKTTAGSVTVQGENTNTTNLQQGLIKAWSTNVADGTSISDSFNVASLTDSSAGVQRNNFTNNMANANYVALMLGVNNSDAEHQWTNKATAYWDTSFYNGSSYVDRIPNSSCTGDLA